MSTLRLHDEERDEIAVLADEFLESLNGDQDPSRMSAAATGAAQRLPERLRTFLAATRTGEEAITVVSNLPVRADLEPTPLGWEPAAKLGAGWHEEGVLALVGAGLAEPFGWTSQQAGRLVHDVCPTPEDDNSLTSASSTRELNFHTEDVFHPCRSDYVALLCLRNPTQVGTTYVRAEALDLPQNVREVLFQERFLFLPDDSHNLGSLPDSAGDGSQLGAVLFGPRTPPTCASTSTSCARCPATTRPPKPWRPSRPSSASTWSGSRSPPATWSSSTTSGWCTAGSPSAAASTAPTAGSSGSISPATPGESAPSPESGPC